MKPLAAASLALLCLLCLLAGCSQVPSDRAARPNSTPDSAPHSPGSPPKSGGPSPKRRPAVAARGPEDKTQVAKAPPSRPGQHSRNGGAAGRPGAAGAPPKDAADSAHADPGKPAAEAQPSQQSEASQEPRPETEGDAAPLRPEEPSAPAPSEGESVRAAKLVIVIDDVGHSVERLRPFLELNVPLTFAIIPGTRQARLCLNLIRSHGLPAMAHLPMEPLSRAKMSAAALTVDSSDEKIRGRLARWLDSLPGIVGANNHQGSRATQDERVVRLVLGAMKERGLFFLDSRTVGRTVVADVARELGVTHLARDGRFLDDGGRTTETYNVLLELGEEARARGHAIGIGHPHPGTARALARAIPVLAARGVRVAPITELVR